MKKKMVLLCDTAYNYKDDIIVVREIDSKGVYYYDSELRWCFMENEFVREPTKGELLYDKFGSFDNFIGYLDKLIAECEEILGTELDLDNIKDDNN